MIAAAATTTANDAATRTLLTLIQLGKRARNAKTAAELGFIMVNESLQLLNYRQAVFWSSGNLGRVAAASGTPTLDTNAPYIQWVTQVARHLQSHQQSGEQATQEIKIDDIPPLLSADWHQWLPAHALWLPLKSPSGDDLGALLLARDLTWTEAEQAMAKELVDTYRHALQALNPPRRWQLQLKEKLKPTRAKLWVTAGVLVVLGFPVHLSVLAPAEVVPIEPFLVRAPLDGVIDKLYVRPNQEVQLDTPLFNLDTTVLQSQHAVAQQAYDTAQEEYRQVAQLAVTDDKSKFDLAVRQGTLAEKSVELAYSASQLGRVQVKAERTGVAVFNDINDWQGKAVALGEKILLLADPEKVELKIDLPASDIIAIAPGAEITLYPNASPLSSYKAKVLTLAYHAEPTPNGVLAYRIRAELDKSQPLPRIGMMGTAKVSGDYVAFGYYLLRKPWVALRQWLGW